MASSSPLLFDLDEHDFFNNNDTDSPSYPNPNDLLLKPEPDLTIQLGEWGNDSLNTTSNTIMPGSVPHTIDKLPSGPPGSIPVPHSAQSALYSASAPPLAPTLFDEGPQGFWPSDYLIGLDPVTADSKSLGHFHDPLMNNANTSIPWAQWTNVNSLNATEPSANRDELEMPPTPVDAFSINVDLYHPSHPSDMSFQQASPPNNDLLSPFGSLGLSSPPMQPATIQSHCNPNGGQTQGLNIMFGPPSMYHDHMAAHYETPSPPASVASIPPTTLDLSSTHVKIVSTGDSHVHSSRSRNNIPTLSSSLPSSFASPHAQHFSKMNNRPSPPSQVPSNMTRSTRSRAVSEVSQRPTPRRRGHSTQDVSEPSNDPLKPPKQSLSTWQFFFTEWIQRQEGRKLNVAQAAKEAGKEYKLLSDAEKEPYARRAAAARLNRQKELSDWHQTLTPSLIALENRYRTAQRKLGLSRRSNLKDPNAPKKPLSAYFMFLKAVREDLGWSEAVFGKEKETTRQSVLAASKWREMSDDEKRPFLARAEHEKLQYEAARKDYEDSFQNEDSASPKLHDSYLSQMNFATPQELSSPRPRANSTGSRAMAFRLDDISTHPNMDGSPSMGYFSTGTSNNSTIPIHIPRRRPRSGSTPSPTDVINS